MDSENAGRKPETHVQVLVTTTSGNFPAAGTDNVPANQPVRQQLKVAAKALGIVDTANWVAKVNGSDINVDKSYVDNGLSGDLAIDYGPAEGGGGRE